MIKTAIETTERNQARIAAANILIAPPELNDESFVKEFFGTVLGFDEFVSDSPALSGKTVYFCGDASKIGGEKLKTAARVFVVREFSRGFNETDDGQSWTLIDAGRVPVSVHGVGVYFRRFFDPAENFFERISTEHVFQSLTESTKPGTAHRTGIYLTPVEQTGDELHFRLLRCSTNLAGPTDNFRAADRLIVDALNRETEFIFRGHAPLNHVLAQIYRNTPAAAAQKQSKAKISAHADKTKDMPAGGIMAFCTFYDRIEKLSPLAADSFDYGHKNVSALTKLQFRLKEIDAGVSEPHLPAQFSVTLYPNSVFFMPLSTNRLYTHEIRASALDAELIPTRLGYVVRCSKTEAVHKNGETFLKTNGNEVALAPPTVEGVGELRRLYAEENRTRNFIDYGDDFTFSMNTGDYLAPQI